MSTPSEADQTPTSNQGSKTGMNTNRKILIGAGAGIILVAATFGAYAAAKRHGWGGHGGMGHGMMFEQMLDRFDANNDGKIGKDEVTSARTSALATYDTDKDGKLSLAEFKPLWAEYAEQRMVRGFQRLDADGDAAVTADELTKATDRLFARLDRNDDGAIDKSDRRGRGWRMRGGDASDDADGDQN